ncbi:hypothetical protein V6N13_133987 [Hibiscus sabdariffa]|uniref:J domain-containing protein n=1 Tax=Hibiscus sabdariffa TaxID=183260 RepID=A0ABR2QZL8_9ROSI
MYATLPSPFVAKPIRSYSAKKTVTVRNSAQTASFKSAHASSLYEILKVERTASLNEIKTAYRSLAKVYHPDAMGSSDCRDFIEIRNAYATLSDPMARALYDMSFGTSIGNRAYTTRRWETDQCW